MSKLQLPSFFRLHWVQVVLTFFIVSMIRFFPVFFQNRTLFFGDNYSLLVPGKLFTVHWLQQGVFPLWNPTIFSGISWIGDISQSIIYPTTFFFLLFPTSTALSVTVLAHLGLTMFGMYRLAHWFGQNHRSALLVSVLWMVSSQMTGSANNLATLQSLAWLPWVLYAAVRLPESRQGFLGLTLALTLNLLAGYPQHILLVLPIAAIFSGLAYYREADRANWSWSRWLSQWFITGVLTLGISAGIFWPFVETLLSSTRMTQSAAQAALGSMHPTELIKVLIPYFFDAPALGLRWGPAWNVFPTALPYLTWLGLGAVIFSLRKILTDKIGRVLVVTAGATSLLAVGRHLPGFIWLISTVPGLSTVRYSSSWLVMVNICWLLLIAMVLPKFKLSRGWVKVSGWLLALIAISGGIGLAVTWFQPGWVWSLLNQLTQQALAQSPFHTQARDQLISLTIFGNLFLNALLTGAALLSFNRRRLWLMVAFLMLDAVVNTQALLLFAPSRVYQPVANQELVETIYDPSYRTLTRNFNLPYTDYGSYWEAVVVRGPFSDSFVDEQELQTGSHLERLKNGLTPDWNMTVPVSVVNGYTTLVPTSYQRQWENPDQARINALSQISLDHPQLKNWAVKYYVTDGWFSINEDLSNQKQIYNQGSWQVYELPTLSRFRYAHDQAVAFSAFAETPNQISFSFNNDLGEAYLKIADRYESGWTAQVNGQAVRVENWDDLRAIPIAAGENQVVVKYWPRSFVWGCVISGVTLAGLILYLTVTHVRSRRRYYTTKSAAKTKAKSLN